VSKYKHQLQLEKHDQKKKGAVVWPAMFLVGSFADQIMTEKNYDQKKKVQLSGRRLK
jgi:hypothetical protein